MRRVMRDCMPELCRLYAKLYALHMGYLGDAQRMPRRCPEDAWEMPRGCMEDARGECPEDFKTPLKKIMLSLSL
jgi:hypothetical protein